MVLYKVKKVLLEKYFYPLSIYFSKENSQIDSTNLSGTIELSDSSQNHTNPEENSSENNAQNEDEAKMLVIKSFEIL